MELSDRHELEWSVAGRPYPGENRSGDRYLVTATSSGWLLAVIDGLGHGPEAADVSDQIVETLGKVSEMPLEKMVHFCHESLKTTRGAACVVATINSVSRQLRWVGVGNVEGVVCHKNSIGSKEYITMQGGILGYRLPNLRPSSITLMGGDIVAMATDGIHPDFADALDVGTELSTLTKEILEDYVKATDDALILVARWRSGETSKEAGG